MDSECSTSPMFYDKPLSFHLTHERPSKTIDIGNNGSSAALEPLGSVGCAVRDFLTA
jgi:hypothetical protein